MGTKIVITSMLALCAISTHTEAKSETRKKLLAELALQYCLSSNYSKIGFDYRKHDFSAYHTRYKNITGGYTPENQIKFTQFIESETSNFYQSRIAVKAENLSEPHTIIFAKCMEFYNSKQLVLFLRKISD